MTTEELIAARRAEPWKKNRFEPSQAFAMCLKKDEYAQIIDLPCEDERVGPGIPESYPFGGS